MNNTWIMPCNLKLFNIDERFEKYDYVIWKNGARIQKDDIVYLYVGKPFSRIKYKCIVEDANIDKDMLADNAYARVGDIEHNRKYMKLKLIYSYEEGVSLEKIQELGMFGVRKQTRLDNRIIAYMKTIDSNLGI